MGSLLTSLLNSANALSVYSQAMQVTENNVTNASTPGYAKQTQVLQALPFDITVGLPGGVAAGPVESARNAFAEQNVRDQQSALGTFQQKASDLAGIKTLSDVSGQSGVSSALTGLFQSFSQLAVRPNDPVARQAVLDQAGRTAAGFQHAAAGVIAIGTAVDHETQNAVGAINHIAAAIAQLNSQHHVDAQGHVDAGVDAKLNTTLEELSQVANFNVLQQPDGSVTVYLGGQTPLVVADQAFAIQADQSAPQTRILNAQGTDITASLTGGSISGMLAVKNQILPSYLTSLNTLAQGVADQVNSTLAGGLDANGAAPSTDLFHYDATVGAALTLGVNPLTQDQVAAALPGAPGGNGNALNLAALANTPALNGASFTQFYGNLLGRAGQDISDAQDGQGIQQQLLTQAQNLRSQSSGVSLDEEAAKLIQFQRSYQAAAKLLQVLDELSGTLMNDLPLTT